MTVPSRCDPSWPELIVPGVYLFLLLALPLIRRLGGLLRRKKIRHVATGFQLPFDSEWMLVKGETLKRLPLRCFTTDAGLRAGLEFVKVKSGPEGLTYHGGGEAKEDYFSFGARVRAPYEGVIIRVIDGFPDQPVGENANQALTEAPYGFYGNLIIIRHPNGLASVLAHLKQGSALVKEGDRVAMGDILAQCGSSGCALRPHLHFHVQKGETLAGEETEAAKVVFSAISIRDAGVRKHYTPKVEERVSNAPKPQLEPA